MQKIIKEEIKNKAQLSGSRKSWCKSSWLTFGRTHASHSGPVYSLFFFLRFNFFRWSLCPACRWNSHPRDQQSQAVLAQPPGAPGRGGVTPTVFLFSASLGAGSRGWWCPCGFPGAARLTFLEWRGTLPAALLPQPCPQTSLQSHGSPAQGPSPALSPPPAALPRGPSTAYSPSLQRSSRSPAQRPSPACSPPPAALPSAPPLPSALLHSPPPAALFLQPLRTDGCGAQCRRNEPHSFPAAGIWHVIVLGHPGRSDAICWHVLPRHRLSTPLSPLENNRGRERAAKTSQPHHACAHGSGTEPLVRRGEGGEEGVLELTPVSLRLCV